MTLERIKQIGGWVLDWAHPPGVSVTVSASSCAGRVTVTMGNEAGAIAMIELADNGGDQAGLYALLTAEAHRLLWKPAMPAAPMSIVGNN